MRSPGNDRLLLGIRRARYAAASKAGHDGVEALPRTNPLRVMLSFMFFPSSPRASRGAKRVCPRAESEMPRRRPPQGPASHRKRGGSAEGRARGEASTSWPKDRKPAWVVLSHRTNCARRHQTCPSAHEWQVLRHEMHFCRPASGCVRRRAAGRFASFRVWLRFRFRIWLRFRFRVWRFSRPKAAWWSGA